MKKLVFVGISLFSISVCTGELWGASARNSTTRTTKKLNRSSSSSQINKRTTASKSASRSRSALLNSPSSSSRKISRVDDSVFSRVKLGDDVSYVLKNIIDCVPSTDIRVLTSNMSILSRSLPKKNVDEDIRTVIDKMSEASACFDELLRAKSDLYLELFDQTETKKELPDCADLNGVIESLNRVDTKKLGEIISACRNERIPQRVISNLITFSSKIKEAKKILEEMNDSFSSAVLSQIEGLPELKNLEATDTAANRRLARRREKIESDRISGEEPQPSTTEPVNTGGKPQTSTTESVNTGGKPQPSTTESVNTEGKPQTPKIEPVNTGGKSQPPTTEPVNTGGNHAPVTEPVNTGEKPQPPTAESVNAGGNRARTTKPESSAGEPTEPTESENTEEKQQQTPIAELVNAGERPQTPTAESVNAGENRAQTTKPESTEKNHTQTVKVESLENLREEEGTSKESVVNLDSTEDPDKFYKFIETNINLLNDSNLTNKQKTMRNKLRGYLKETKSERSFEQKVSEVSRIIKTYNSLVALNPKTIEGKNLSSVRRDKIKSLQERIYLDVFDDLSTRIERIKSNEKLNGLNMRDDFEKLLSFNERNKEKFLKSGSGREKREIMISSAEAYDKLMEQIWKHPDLIKNKEDRREFDRIGYTLDPVVLSISVD